MDPPIRLRLLGGFDLQVDGEPVPRLPRKAKAMLAYLVLAGGRPPAREVLGDLFWPAAAPVSHVLWDYLAKAGWAIGLGLLIGGIVDHYIPKEYISRALSGHHHKTLWRSVGLGFLASSCSHGCLALSMELYRKGASPSSVITFLLASPWASMSMTLLIITVIFGDLFVFIEFRGPSIGIHRRHGPRHRFPFRDRQTRIRQACHASHCDHQHHHHHIMMPLVMLWVGFCVASSFGQSVRGWCGC